MSQHSEKREPHGSGGEKKTPGPVVQQGGQNAKGGSKNPQNRHKPMGTDRRDQPDGHTDVDVDDRNDRPE